MEEINLYFGVATPEGYDEERVEALHVLNVNFVGEANRSRVVKFTCARVLHFDRHLPRGSSQRIRFDLRGQLVSNRVLELVRQSITQLAFEHGVKVSVEFLTS